MEIRIRCPHCKKKYRVPESYKQRAIKCSACGYPFFVLVEPGSSPGGSVAGQAPSLEPTAAEIERARFLREKAAEETKVAMPSIQEPVDDLPVLDPPQLPSIQKPTESLPPIKRPIAAPPQNEPPSRMI